MKFREVTLAYNGAKGIVPEGWERAGEARFARGPLQQDPTMLWLRAYPHIDVERPLAALRSVRRCALLLIPHISSHLPHAADWASRTREQDALDGTELSSPPRRNWRVFGRV